jgi:hypothetical protein
MSKLIASSIISNNLEFDVDLSNSNSKLGLPVGPTTNRPAEANEGYIRYNSDFKAVEYYDGTTWQGIQPVNDYDEIAKAGLGLNLDASSLKSYPGTGNRWHDLTNHNRYCDASGAFYTSSDSGVFNFDGADDHLTGRLDYDTTINPNFTVEAWIYGDSWTDTSSYQSIMNRTDGTSANHDFSCFIQTSSQGNPGRMASWIFNSGGTNIVHDSGAAGENLVLQTGVWNHCVWVFVDGVGYTYYLNGGPGYTHNTGTTRRKTTSDPYTIGRWVNGNYAFDGKMSNIKFYDRALNPKEVWKNYAAVAPRFGITPIPSIITSGLVAHYDAADYRSYPRSGTVWYDLTGNGNDVIMDASLVPTFEDNLYFRVNNGANFEKTDANIELSNITMIAWYKNITLNTTAPRVLELFKTGSQVSNSHALAPDLDGTLRAWVESGDSTSGSRIASADDSTQYPLNEWIMFAYTYDGSIGRIYVDGKQTATAGGSSTVLDDINVITIGAISDQNTYQHGNYYMHADISVVMVYTRALAAEEIEQNYKAYLSRYQT